MAYRVTNAHDWDAAADLWRKTLGAYPELAAMQPGNSNARRHVALCHKRLAAVLTQQKNLAGAERHYREALRIDSERAWTNGPDMEAMSDLALDLSDLGLVLAALGRTGDRTGGIEQMTESPPIFEKLCERDPANVEWRREYAIGLLQLGVLHRELAEEGSAAAPRGAWMSAVSRLERARAELGKIEGRVNFVETEREQIASLNGELERCKAALGRSGPEGRPARKGLLSHGRRSGGARYVDHAEAGVGAAEPDSGQDDTAVVTALENHLGLRIAAEDVRCPAHSGDQDRFAVRGLDDEDGLLAGDTQRADGIPARGQNGLAGVEGLVDGDLQTAEVGGSGN